MPKRWQIFKASLSFVEKVSGRYNNDRHYDTERRRKKKGENSPTYANFVAQILNGESPTLAYVQNQT